MAVSEVFDLPFVCTHAYVFAFEDMSRTGKGKQDNPHNRTTLNLR